MQLVYADRVKETSTTTGTGTYTLAGAVTGFQSFAAIGNGKQCIYVAEDGTNWEVGIGTYTSSGTTLARTTILSSSNSNAAVNWAAGTRNVYCVQSSGVVGAFGYDPAGVPTPPITGTRSIAIGSGSSANNTDAIAMGNHSNASGASAVAIGNANSVGPTASGSYSMAFGSGTASGSKAIAMGQAAPQATGNGSIAVAAYTAANNASGVDAVAFGGANNSAVGNFSWVGGYSGLSRFWGAVALGGGDTALLGKAQSERMIQRITTTDATVTPLEFDANAAGNGYIQMALNSGASVIVHVIGRETSTGDSCAFRLEGNYATDGSGNPSLVGSTLAAVDLGHAAGASTWAAALAVDNSTNFCLLVNVTGQAGKTIKWVARIDLVEVAG